MGNDGARNVVSGLVAAAALVGLTSCSATRLTEVWKDPGYSGGPLRQVAVFVFGADANGRRVTEDAFVQRLPASTRGAAGNGLVPADEQADVDKVRARLQAGGFDGAILVQLVNVEEAQTWIPSVLQRTPAPQRTLGEQYTAAYQAGQRAGDGPADTTVRVQAHVYGVASQSPIWSGASRAINSTVVREMTEGVAEAVIERLQEAGVLTET
jgi:hypothetical protein